MLIPLLVSTTAIIALWILAPRLAPKGYRHIRGDLVFYACTTAAIGVFWFSTRPALALPTGDLTSVRTCLIHDQNDRDASRMATRIQIFIGSSEDLSLWPAQLSKDCQLTATLRTWPHETNKDLFWYEVTIKSLVTYEDSFQGVTGHGILEEDIVRIIVRLHEQGWAYRRITNPLRATAAPADRRK